MAGVTPRPDDGAGAMPAFPTSMGSAGPGAVQASEALPVLDLRDLPPTGSLAEAHWRNHRLAGLRLPDADLERIFIESCTLDDAELERTALVRAHIIDSRLRRARLSGASLRSAVLVNVDLRDADLAGADLHGAVLVFCDLRGARLQGADLRDVVWSHTDLRGVELATCRLEGSRGDFYWDDATTFPP